MTCDRCGSGRWLNPDNIDEELKESGLNNTTTLEVSDGCTPGTTIKFQAHVESCLALRGASVSTGGGGSMSQCVDTYAHL